jgi:arylsulfatase A-like enzyme
MTWAWDHAAQEGEIAVADQPNILFFHVDNLGFGELSCYSGGPLRGRGPGASTRFPGRGSG